MQKITQEDRLLEQKWTSLAQEFKTRKFVDPTAPIPLSAPLSDNDSDVEECMSQHQVQSIFQNSARVDTTESISKTDEVQSYIEPSLDLDKINGKRNLKWEKVSKERKSNFTLAKNLMPKSHLWEKQLQARNPLLIER